MLAAKDDAVIAMTSVNIYMKLTYIVYTAPVLLADYVTTGNQLKWRPSRPIISEITTTANFNFNLTVIRLQQLNILSNKQAKYCRK